MPSRILNLARIVTIALLAIAAHWLHAQQSGTKSAPSILIEGLGKGTAPLIGPWQFHPGDNPAWANPAFDSSSWEQLSASRPWGEQGYNHLTGYAWYRLSITLTPAPGIPPEFSLLVPDIDDAYEIYWNGALIGRNGKLQSPPVWYISQPAQTFRLGKARSGLLAIRVWKAPLLSDDSGRSGGFETAPSIGSPEAIATAQSALEMRWLSSSQLVFGENLLCAAVALLSFLLWCRAPSQRLLFWMTCFSIIPPLNLLLVDAHMGWPYPLAMGAEQPLTAIQDISLWFLLLWLLRLYENRTLARITRILACFSVAINTLDGVLVAISWNPQWIGFIQIADAALAFLYLFPGIFPMVLVSCAFFERKRLDSSRWLVAILAFLDGMLVVFHDAIKQGRQFTDWSIAYSIDEPIFTIHGCAVFLPALAEVFLLVAIVYAVYNSVREDQRRQDALEREKRELMRESARMRHHAEHDGLTGLWNHRVIVDRLEEEINHSRHCQTPLSVILIDVDHFKKINDSHGHPAGDLVLKEISAIFARSLEPGDCAGRYGGEEFLLILPGCAMEDAVTRAEQMRLAVQAACIMDGETRLQVTASFGVAPAYPSNCEADAIIRAVDTALYRAKSNGRNCVIAAEMDIPQKV